MQPVRIGISVPWDLWQLPYEERRESLARIADAAVEQLRARRFSYGDDRCAMEVSLAQDEVYSDDYKARLMEGFTDTAEAEAAALA